MGSDFSGAVGRARVEARAATQVAASATQLAASATADYAGKVGRDLKAHRTELVFLLATLAFAVIVGVAGFAALPTY